MRLSSVIQSRAAQSVIFTAIFQFHFNKVFGKISRQACKKRTIHWETLPILLWLVRRWKQFILISEYCSFSRTVANVCSLQVPRPNWYLASMINQRVQLLNFRHVVWLWVVATLHLNGFLTCLPIHVSRAGVSRVSTSEAILLCI